MTLTIQIDDAETELIQKYAEENQLTLAELFKPAVIEKIDD